MKQYPNLIGLCGRQFSGKSMLATYLVENKGYERVYVAQALKQLCSKLLSLSIEEMDKLKKIDVTIKLDDTDLKFISDTTNISFGTVKEAFKKINNTLTSIRNTYQFIGTDIIRKYHPNWHIDMMLKGMKEDKQYVVDDVRFLNEYDTVKKLGGILIYIVRPQLVGVSHHESEESLKWRQFEHIIINNLKVEDAEKQLTSLIEKGENKYADSMIKSYNKDFQDILKSRNQTIIVEEKEFPVKLSAFDKNAGWIFEEFNGIEQPLVIEDFKFYYQE